MPLGKNQILGDAGKPVIARPHRVALGDWPTMIDDPRVKSLHALGGHLAGAGYEGVEYNIKEMAARFFPGDSLPVVAGRAREVLASFGLSIFGSTMLVTDESMRKLNWIDAWIEQMKLVQDMGGQYVNFQIFLHDDHLNTGGAYRNDQRYLQWCADRVRDLRDAAWSVGINMYLETHVDRITDDPQACCRILELTPCEITGDLSHYVFRGYLKGPYVDTIRDHMGHTHVRLARTCGDLSAVVDDPKADWQQQGVTWTLFQFMKRGLRGGLSSRVIMGETGPMHLVKNRTLDQDAKLVPLWRAMARYADASVQGFELKVNEPGDLKPWG